MNDTIHHITMFQQLDAWKQARRVTQLIYILTRKGRLARDYGVACQVQRASVSVMNNVAEGFGRQRLQEKLQFYNVARASATEVLSMLYVIEDNFPEFARDAVTLREEACRSGQLVSGLIRSTEARKSRLSLPRALTALFGFAGF